VVLLFSCRPTMSGMKGMFLERAKPSPNLSQAGFWGWVPFGCPRAISLFAHSGGLGAQPPEPLPQAGVRGTAPRASSQSGGSGRNPQSLFPKRGFGAQPPEPLPKAGVRGATPRASSPSGGSGRNPQSLFPKQGSRDAAPRASSQSEGLATQPPEPLPKAGVRGHSPQSLFPKRGFGGAAPERVSFLSVLYDTIHPHQQT
jgi:hypothetical protein